MDSEALPPLSNAAAPYVPTVTRERLHWRFLVKTALALLAASCAPLTASRPPAFAICTFESRGLCYNRPEARTPCIVSYRAQGAQEWRQGYPPVYDAR